MLVAIILGSITGSAICGFISSILSGVLFLIILVVRGILKLAIRIIKAVFRLLARILGFNRGSVASI